MAHLPARPRLRLSIEMQLDVRESAGRRPVRFALCPQGSEKIRHPRWSEQLGRPEREAADRAHLLLELAGDGGVERQVAGIVRPRRQLVDEEVTVGRHEEIYAQQADRVPRLAERAGD